MSTIDNKELQALANDRRQFIASAISGLCATDKVTDRLAMNRLAIASEIARNAVMIADAACALMRDTPYGKDFSDETK